MNNIFFNRLSSFASKQLTGGNSYLTFIFFPLNRLSSFASKQLTEGNAAFTDLSDKNRPTKIGERFGLIFDDEWSEAFEELKDGGMDDQSVISKLLQIIQVRQRLDLLLEILIKTSMNIPISFTFYYKKSKFEGQSLHAVV